MTALLITALLIFQGIPVRPTEGGTITGAVRNALGLPAAGVRVAAMSRPDSTQDAADGAAMAAVSQTDAQGRYRLENVAPGQYYITSGRIDLPIFYPGTLEMVQATPVRITPGLVVSNIDFTVTDVSFVLAGVSSTPSGISIPVQVTVEGGGPVPVFSSAGFALLSVSDSAGFPRTAVPLSGPSMYLPMPLLPQEYEIRGINLPAGYTVKSLSFGAVDLMSGRLRLSAVDAPLTLTSPATPTISTLPSVYSLRSALIDTGTGSVPLAPGSLSPIAMTAVLSVSSLPAPKGARVSGRVPDTRPRSITLSNVPGILYADGSFEVAGVPPGHHTLIAAGDSTAPHFGASVVVGARDIVGLTPEPVVLTPRETPPIDATAGLPEGVVLPLSTLRGTLFSQTTGETLRGSLSIVGRDMQVTYGVGTDGRFEIPKLLPGSYNLQVTVFDYFTVNEAVTIGYGETIVEVRARRAY